MSESDGGDATHVVTCVLRNRSDVLLLRRSDAVGSYAGLWGMVAGHAEGDPEGQAWLEIDEETGLRGACTLVREGEPFPVDDPEHGRWIVHPFLFESATRSVDPNYETDELEWVQPPVVRERETVPDLWTSYERVAPTVGTVRDDREHGSAYLSVRAVEVLRDRAAVLADAVRAGERDDGAARADLAALARELRDARPVMQVVANRVNRVMARAAGLQTGGAGSPDGDDATGASGWTPADVREAAESLLDDVHGATDALVERATDRVAGRRVLTLSRSGTVRALLAAAGPEAVYVAESRPAREGVGVAERLAAATDADVHLCVDAAVAHVLATEDVDCVVVGADTVLPDGRVVNKVGTRGAALAATREGVPLFVATARDKVSPDDAVHRESGDASAVYDGDADVAVLAPTFDVTPADCVTALLTEDGALAPGDVAAVAESLAALRNWEDQ